MASYATQALGGWRNEACLIPISVPGVDLTGVAVRAQIRQNGDNPVLTLDLPSGVADGVTGIRALPTTLDAAGIATSHLILQIAKADMQALPYAGEAGDPWVGEYALQIAGVTRLIGPFAALASPIDSDGAPANRPVGWGGAAGGALPSGVMLTIGDAGVTVSISGADLLAPMVAAVTAALAAVQQARDIALAAGHGQTASLLTRQGYIDLDGTFVADGGWQATDPQPLASVGSNPSINLQGATGARSIAFFGPQMTPISGVAAAAAGGYVNVYPAPPAGAEYVVFCGQANAPNQLLAFTRQLGTLAARLDHNADAFIGNLAALMDRVGWVDTTDTLQDTGSGPWLHSDYIRVRAGYTVSVDLWAHPGARGLSVYDANLNVVDSIANTGGAPAQIIGSRKLTVDGYIRLSGSVLASAYPSNISGNRATYALPADLEGSVGDMLGGTQHIGILQNNGVPAPGDTNWCFTSPQQVKAGRVIRFSAAGTTTNAVIAFTDANGTFQPTATVLGTGTAYPVRLTGKFTVPADGSVQLGYFNPNSPNPPSGTPALSFVSPVFTYDEPDGARPKSIVTQSDTIVLYGDSRMSNLFDFVRDAWESLFGCRVIASGWSGHTVAQNASNADLASIFTGPDPRMIPFMPGGNDTGAAGTVGTFSAISINAMTEAVVQPTDITKDYANTGGTTFIQAVDHTVRKIVAQYENVRARAGVTGDETEAQRAALMAAVVRPMLVLITDLPQQRGDATQAASQPANWERKRQAIIEVATLRKVRFCDVQGMLAINMGPEPFYPAGGVANTTYGNLYLDGVHPSLILAMMIAECVKAEFG